MDNVHLFQMLNAGPGLAPGPLALALFLADWVVIVAVAGWVWAWLRSGRRGNLARLELLNMAAALLVALVLAQVVEWVWPQPRPFVLNLGTQYLEHAADASLPDDHTVVLWALGIAALRTTHYGTFAFPLLALGLLCGLSWVVLGIHFPYDIVAALPVAAAGDLCVLLARRRLDPLLIRLAPWLGQLEERMQDKLRSRGGR
jgi:undecaprenyl-diphosphatase